MGLIGERDSNAPDDQRRLQGTDVVVTCRVGYALNPKKLRKSITESHSFFNNNHGTPTFLGASFQQNDGTATQSPLQLKTKHAAAFWNGGGLADIISGGVECEGVQFIPWNHEVPVQEQVRLNRR
jgi:hypothetical protein